MHVLIHLFSRHFTEHQVSGTGQDPGDAQMKDAVF